MRPLIMSKLQIYFSQNTEIKKSKLIESNIKYTVQHQTLETKTT